MAGECSSSSLEFFSETPIQNEITDGRYQKIAPETGITPNSKQIDFTVTGKTEVLDLNNTFIETTFRLLTGAGAALPGGTEASAINYIGSTMWQQIKLSLGGQWVATATDQPYRAMLETLSTMGKGSIRTWLQAAGWYTDTAGKHDDKSDANVGFKLRKGLAAGGNTVTVYSRIHCDLFNQDKYLIPGVPVRLSLTRHSDDFCIMAATDDADVKIEIVDVNLHVYKLELIGSKLTETTRLLQSNDAKYNYSAMQLYTSTEAKGPLSAVIHPQFATDDIPTRILVAMVSNDAFNGKKSKNPFNFQTFNIKSINILLDGKSIHGSPQEFNPAKSVYDAGYWALQQATGYMFKNEGLSISKEEYANGNFIMAYNLSPTQCDGSYRDPIKTGKLSIDLKFNEALPHTINILVLAEFERLMTINKFYKVVTNT